jgi:EAL domain-containing protein (putative c-di-GMP-specific phosphodiesterase class I)
MNAAVIAFRDMTDHQEALLRMHGRDGRIMLPGAFLPAAERYGLIQRIDMRVIDTLLAALHEHRPAFSPGSHPHVNVNLSDGSFSDTRVADHVPLQDFLAAAD